MAIRQEMPCAECGTLFVPQRITARYCSWRCSSYRHPGGKRARKLGLPNQSIPRFTLHERDGWTCHICGQATGGIPGEVGPLAPTVDHLIPLSVVGSPGHVWENVATAHMRCNRAKRHHRSDLLRIDVQQVPKKMAT